MESLAKSGAFADMIAQGVPAPDLIALAQAAARQALAKVWAGQPNWLRMDRL